MINVDDIVKEGSINEPALKHMLETIPYEIQKTNKKKIFTLDNGVIIYVEQNNIYRVDTPSLQYYFRNNKLRRIINLASHTTTAFLSDGQTKESFLRADGYHVFFKPDGKTPQYIQTPQHYKIYYHDDGQTFHYITLDQNTKYIINEKLSMRQLIEAINIIKKITSTELPAFSVKINRHGYKNELASFDASKLPSPPKGYQEIHDPKIFPDELVPEVMKKIGIHIKRQTEVIYPQYDATQNKCTFRNQQHQIFTPDIEDRIAFVSGTTITVNTCQYMFPQEDAEFYTSLHQLILDKSISPATKKEILKRYPLGKRTIYLNIFKKNEIYNTLMHEIKHIYNHLLCEHRAYASDYKKPTMEDQYRLCTENERTATFAPILHWLNQYYKQTNQENYDIIPPQYDWVVPILKEAKQQKLSHTDTLSKVLNACLERWNTNYQDSYFDDFKAICQTECLKCLLIPEDKNHQEFLKQRRLMYTFSVYDPISKTEKYIDLSPLITTDIPITEKVKKEIIEPCKKTRAEQKKRLINRLGGKEKVIAAANLAHTLRRQKVQQYLADSSASPIPQIIDESQRAVPICKNIYNAWTSCWSKIAHLLTIKKSQYLSVFQHSEYRKS